MTGMVSPSPLRGPCGIAPKAYAMDPYAHEEAVAAIIQRDCVAVARDVQVAPRTAQGWRETGRVEDHEAGGSPGGIGPGRLLSRLIQVGLDLGRDVPTCLEPLRVISRERLPVAASRDREAAVSFVRELAALLGYSLVADDPVTEDRGVTVALSRVLEVLSSAARIDDLGAAELEDLVAGVAEAKGLLGEIGRTAEAALTRRQGRTR